MNLLDIRLPEMIGLTILHSMWQITFLWIVLVAVLRLCPKASSAVRYAFAISILMLSVLITAATAVYEWQLHATSDEISVLSNGTTQGMHTAYHNVKQTLFTGIVDALNASVPLLGWLWWAGLVVMGARFGGSFFLPEHIARTREYRKDIAFLGAGTQASFERARLETGGCHCYIGARLLASYTGQHLSYYPPSPWTSVWNVYRTDRSNTGS